MSAITEGNAEQYADSHKLAARARLHREYSISEVGWFPLGGAATAHLLRRRRAGYRLRSGLVLGACGR